MKTITSANSVFTLTVPGVLPAPFTLQGYAADDAFSSEAVDTAETSMGVDGKMSAGYVPRITPMRIVFQPDSDSIDVFEAWLGFEDVRREVFFAEAILALPSVQKAYAMHKGCLKRITPFPAAKKVLQPVEYSIDWEAVQAIPLPA